MIALENQVAVVTGASGGIGEAIAIGLAEKRVKLCLVGRNVEKLRGLKEKRLKLSPKIEICRADLTNEKDIKSISCFVEKNSAL